MTSEDFTIDDPDDSDDERTGAFLRISRDATVDDLAGVLPDMTTDERADWLRKLRQDERSTVTLAVTVDVPVSTINAFGQTIPVRTITGLIIGPPGSEQFLRRPAEQRVRPDGARHNAEPADPEAVELVCLYCAGLLVPLVDGGHEHSDDADTTECITMHDGRPPAGDDDPERIAARAAAGHE